jgi:hypothetical protein
VAPQRVRPHAPVNALGDAFAVVDALADRLDGAAISQGRDSGRDLADRGRMAGCFDEDRKLGAAPFLA